MARRQLFGGSVECKIPEGWRDVSDIRQVPDHQECWQDDQGQLLVIEILDYQTDVNDDRAAHYFFQDLAESNGVVNSQDVSFAPSICAPVVASLPPTAVLCTGSGSQRIIQGRQRIPQLSDPIWINVELCVIRLPSVSTDILITLTSPAASNPQGDGNNGTKPSFEFLEVLESFRIRDWSLFGL